VQTCGEGVGVGTPTRSTGVSGPIEARPARYPTSAVGPVVFGAAVAAVVDVAGGVTGVDVGGEAFGVGELAGGAVGGVAAVVTGMDVAETDVAGIDVAARGVVWRVPTVATEGTLVGAAAVGAAHAVRKPIAHSEKSHVVARGAIVLISGV